VQLEDETIEASPEVTPEVVATTNALLRQSQSLPANTQMLFQRLVTERIRVQEVSYRYGKSELKRLWVYGEPRQVYAPDAPRAWGRIWAVTLAALAVVSVIAFFVVSQPASELPASPPITQPQTGETNTGVPSPPNENPASIPSTPEADIEDLREQIRQSPDDAVLHDSLAQVYLRQKMVDKAAYHLKQVIKLAPGTERAKAAQEALEKTSPSP
jgi:cytochrome c-type biogenesis protein CcmH/NrfG